MEINVASFARRNVVNWHFFGWFFKHCEASFLLLSPCCIHLDFRQVVSIVYFNPNVKCFAYLPEWFIAAKRAWLHFIVLKAFCVCWVNKEALLICKNQLFLKFSVRPNGVAYGLNHWWISSLCLILSSRRRPQSGRWSTLQTYPLGMRART